MENREIAIQLKNVKKMYKLGQIGGGTLQADLQSWWARKRGKEDPNTKIDADQRLIGKTFMALNGINLTIYKGEAVGIIGSNGAGKSTMLKLLSRVTAPTEGDIDIYGRIASMLEVGTGFHPEMTGRENVYLNGAILGMTKEEIDAKMEQIIEFSEVRDFIDTPVKRYSSGMFVKLAFSVAAHLDSEIMIMDEVLAVGDMAFQKKCLGKMREAANRDGRTVLYVSHNMSTIRQLCDRCIVLDKGKVVFEGDVEKAISIYIGTGSAIDLPNSYDFTKVKRNYGFGKEAFIKMLSFHKSIPSFSSEEDIRFDIEINSKIDVEQAVILLPIKTNNYEKLGMAVSDPFYIRKNVVTRITFSFSPLHLSSGFYCFGVELASIDGLSNSVPLDNPGKMIILEINENYTTGISWKKEFWGNVVFNQIKLIKEG